MLFAESCGMFPLVVVHAALVPPAGDKGSRRLPGQNDMSLLDRLSDSPPNRAPCSLLTELSEDRRSRCLVMETVMRRRRKNRQVNVEDALSGKSWRHSTGKDKSGQANKRIEGTTLPAVRNFPVQSGDPFAIGQPCGRLSSIADGLPYRSFCKRIEQVTGHAIASPAAAVSGSVAEC
ncbi:hypothetical protein BDN67DRAFT_980165 [Paxillus ammoniavirescens]|nr:hypothetical protein BDN67DRAFT_980165 [Paxillus ammoniavirescens]